MDVCVDVGRSHVRVASWNGDAAQRRHLTGGAGLGDITGIAGVAAVVRSAVAGADGAQQPAEPWRLAVALPGVETDRTRALALADQLRSGWERAPRLLVVVSDAEAWQLGACAGGDGVVLAVGTGAVAISRTGDRTGRADGFGLLLGDDGGGAWIGREALRAAVRGHRRLREAGTRRCGPVGAWPGLAQQSDGPALLASVAPDVLELARAGDPVARDILDRATRWLTATLDQLDPPRAPAVLDIPAVRGQLPRPPVSVVGGLGRSLGRRLRAASAEGGEHRRRWVDARGDACDGARLLLDRADTPFEPQLVRVGGPGEDRGIGGSGGDDEGSAAGDSVTGHETDLLATERAAEDVEDMDSWPTRRLVHRLLAGQAVAIQATGDAIPGLTRAADAVADALRDGGRLVYVGAGTPGRIAVQDAAELSPTFGLEPGRAVVLLAGGAEAAGVAVEGAEDDSAQAARDVDAIDVGPADVVVGVSASGRTPYVLAAVARARERGAGGIGIANVAGSALAAGSDIVIELLTGPEVVAGSTRLAAGTAQKMALNTISTAAMIRCGATYGPWMVDLRATNAKLRRRAVRIVRDAAGVSESRAEQTLTGADGSVKVALVMALGGLTADQAGKRLASAGSVRRALAEGDVGDCDVPRAATTR